MSTPDVTLRRTIACAREVVYDAWLDPQSLVRFMCPTPETWVGKADVDPVVGGAFEIVMVAGEQEIPHTGEYKVLDRPSKISFTWVSSMAGDDSVVDIELAEVDGGCELTLIHRGLPTAEAAQNHEGGWSHILDTLVKTLV